MHQYTCWRKKIIQEIKTIRNSDTVGLAVTKDSHFARLDTTPCSYSRVSSLGYVAATQSSKIVATVGDWLFIAYSLNLIKDLGTTYIARNSKNSSGASAFVKMSATFLLVEILSTLTLARSIRSRTKWYLTSICLSKNGSPRGRQKLKCRHHIQ